MPLLVLLEGDDVVLVASPVAQDHARRAVLAALGLRRTLRERQAELFWGVAS